MLSRTLAIGLILGSSSPALSSALPGASATPDVPTGSGVSAPSAFTSALDVTGAPGFDSEATKRALDKVLYEDCKDDESHGPGKLDITFGGDGHVRSVSFHSDPPPAYSAKSAACVIARFEKVKTRPFGAPAPTKTVLYLVSL